MLNVILTMKRDKQNLQTARHLMAPKARCTTSQQLEIRQTHLCLKRGLAVCVSMCVCMHAYVCVCHRGGVQQTRLIKQCVAKWTCWLNQMRTSKWFTTLQGYICNAVLRHAALCCGPQNLLHSPPALAPFASPLLTPLACK